MARRARALLLATMVLLVAVVVVLGVALVVVGAPALLGVLAVAALVVGLLPRSRRHLRPRARVHVDGTTSPVVETPADGRWSMQWETDLPPGTIALVREHVHRELADRDLSGEQAESALIVLTELLSNAVEHGRPPVRVLVAAVEGTVRVEVRDAAAAQPHRQPHDPHRLRGRGLHLVEELSSRWGWTDEPAGKVVWAEVAPASRP